MQTHIIYDFFFFCLAGITLSAKVNNNTFITAGLLAVADCNAFGSYDDIDGKEKRFENKDGEDSCAEDRGVLSSDYKQLNGTISEMDKMLDKTGEEAGKVGVDGNTEIMVVDNEKTENEEKLVVQSMDFVQKK